MISLSASVTGSIDMSVYLKQDARMALDNARIEYDPRIGKPRFSAKTSQNLNNLQVIRGAVIKGTASLSGRILELILKNDSFLID